VLRAKVAEKDGKTALVLGVPMEECKACRDRWLSWETARRHDELLTGMLEGDFEVATRHFEPADQPAA
jgi:hypothetical protein